MNKNIFRKKIIIALLLCASISGTVFFTGCGQNNSDSSGISQSSASSSEQKNSEQKVSVLSESSNSTVSFDSNDTDASYDENTATKIKFGSSSAEISGNSASANKAQVTISSSGTYIISGSTDDGNIKINAGKDDVVKLVLDNASIGSKTSPAIYSSKAKKTIIIIPDGTSSTLSDGSSYVTESSENSDTSSTESSDSNNPNAAVFCQDDLTILGNGTLNVKGNAKNAITSKDVLRISGGTININAKNNGITGKDNLAIIGGNITVTCDGDGIRSTYSKDDDDSKGHIFIENAVIDINSQEDGIQAEKNLIINSGTFKIKTGNGSEDSSTKANSSKGGNDLGKRTETSQTNSSTETTSRKGIKAGTDIIINNGTFTLDTYDDAVHCNGNIEINNGTFEISTGDDGIHADDTLSIKNGKITVSKSYEGLEGNIINISGGTIDVTSSDDGLNAAGGNDSSGFGGNRPPDNFRGRINSENNSANESSSNSDTSKVSSENSSEPQLTISGGTVYINADGDGPDSNGNLTISGGTVVINGTTSNGDGIIDHDGNCRINGGNLIGSGTYGMLEMPESSSKQNSVAIMFTDTQKAGTLVYITDSDGNILTAMTPQKDYSCIVFSSSQLETGKSYIVYTGGTATGKSVNGYYSQASVKDGTKYTEFTISESVTYADKNGNTTYSGMGNRNGNANGNRPDGTPPDSNNQNGTPPDGNRPNGTPPDGNPPTPPDNQINNNSQTA